MTVIDDYTRGRSAAMLEAAAWLENAAGLYLKDSVEWTCFIGAAKFMKQRSREIIGKS